MQLSKSGHVFVEYGLIVAASLLPQQFESRGCHPAGGGNTRTSLRMIEATVDRASLSQRSFLLSDFDKLPLSIVIMSSTRLSLCACSRTWQLAAKRWQGTSALSANLQSRRTFYSSSGRSEPAAPQEPLTSLEPSGLNKTSLDAEKQKNETTAVRALDRLSSALRIKEAGNERHHKLSRIRGGGALSFLLLF